MVARSCARFPFLAPLVAALVPPALLAGAACSCGEKAAEPEPSATTAPASQDSGPSTSGRASKPAPVALTSEEPYESSELGGLHGTILFEGTPPEPFLLGATNLPECKHHTEVDQRSNEIVVNDGKLAGVFVSLVSGFDKTHVPPAPATAVTLEQKGCMYVPRVLALRVGQALQVTNGDPTNHNVHTNPKRNDGINRNMGAEQPALEFRFDKVEYPVPFACDIHPWMRAEVFVEEHPWFAVTDEHGAFRIRDVPPGDYVVEAVHAKLGKVTGTVSVKSAKSTGFTLTLRK